MNTKDADFVRIALACGWSAEKSAELGLKRGLLGAEHEFAQKVLNDHTKISDELRLLAKAKDIIVPGMPDEKVQSQLNDLGQEKDMDFPLAFLQFQIKSHQQAISAFKDASDHANDIAVQRIAVKHRPTLQEHLKQANDLARLQADLVKTRNMTKER